MSEPPRVLVTGSRIWTDEGRIYGAMVSVWNRFDRNPRLVFVHGGARGADTVADTIAKEFGLIPEVHPVTPEVWRRLGKSAGIRRNVGMIDSGIDWCLAFKVGETNGTKHCSDLAIKRHIPTEIYYEDGTYELHA